MSSSKEYATGPVMCTCSAGSAPAMIPPSQAILLVGGMPVLTEADIMSTPPMFATCTHIPTPAGPGPCAPSLSPWMETSNPETLNGLKILLKNSMRICALGGTVKIQG